MRDKDLIYVGIIAYLAYLLLNKNKKEEVKVNDTKTNPVKNASNGGLNLPSNMGLPNLTPTPPDGLSTEDALNESNISPLIKDNEPEQLFGSYNLPTPYNSTPVITPPQAQEIVSNQTLPTDNVGSVINTPILEDQPTPAVEITEPPKPVGSSIIEEPILPIKVIKSEISTTLPIMNEPEIVEEVTNIVSKCGNSFSLPNNDKEGSYTNYWVDGKDFYNQTTSPLIKTVPVKISYEAFIEGCKKYQMF
jgi:hypothetical protein